MDLVQSYCVTLNKDGSYTIDFNTTVPATVSYSTERDGTNVITVNNATKGDTSFSNNFSKPSSPFKYVFDQPSAAERKRIPSGSMQP